MAVEVLHEAGGGDVGNLPERGDDGAAPANWKARTRPTRPSPPISLPSPGVAGREGDQVRVEPQLVEDLSGLEQVVVLALGRMLGQGQGRGELSGKSLSISPWQAKWMSREIRPEGLPAFRGVLAGAEERG